MENKKTLSKKAKIIIAVIAALLVITSLVLTIVFVSMDKNHTALNKEEPNSSLNPNPNDKEETPPVIEDNGTDMDGGEKAEFEKVEELVGNTTLTPEREVLLEPNIIKTLDFANSKLPILNEEGNYYTDENSTLVCYEIELRDYTGMKENLIIIVNAMADAENRSSKVVFTLYPSRRTFPDVGDAKPLSSCIIVDFPEPVCPITPVMQWARMPSETSSSAFCS